MRSTVLALVAGISAASAFNYTIGVGKDQYTGLPGIGFDPSRTVTTGTNDLVVFSFLQGEHHVVQSSFESPCTALAGGFDTKLVTVANGTVSGGPSFTFPVANGSTIAYFSDIGAVNCFQGAVFCVNTNETSTTSCGDFKAAALALGAAQGISTSIRSNSAFSVPSTSTPAQPSTMASAMIMTSGSPVTASAAAAATQTGKSGAGKLVGGSIAAGIVGMAVGLVL